MKVVFLGTGDFAVPSLRALHQAGHHISLVVSQPDRPQGRGLTLQPTKVKSAALALGLPLFQPDRLRLDPGPVIAEKADVLVVVAYGQILRENVLSCAPSGAVNVHASLLPKYRGAAPIQWAIANGETLTGVTIMQLDRGMDTGPILRQREHAIEPTDTTASLEPRLASLGASLLVETLKALSEGSVTPQAQEEAAATNAPLIKKADGLVTFERTATEIGNRLRGFSPWPGLQFVQDGKSVRILEALALNDASTNKPGTILGISRDGLDVVCGQGSVLRLLRVQPESRGAASAFDFANGNRLKPDAVLGVRSPGSND